MPASKRKGKSRKSKQPPKKSKVIVTIALYGPNDTIATKLVASVLGEKSGRFKEMKKWFSDGEFDVRELNEVVEGIGELARRWNPTKIVSPDRIIGCPHEEGIDYPVGEACPQCPFWRHRDRFTGEIIQ